MLPILQDIGCNFPDCKCEVPDYALSNDVRKDYCTAYVRHLLKTKLNWKDQEDSLVILQERLLEEQKKGKKMNDQISNDMAEANKAVPPVDPTAPVISQLTVQTEADVGAETPETRVN